MSDEAAVTPPGRVLREGQRARVWVSDLSGERRLVHESSDVLFEAPNWGGDGMLVLNGDGRLWELPVDGSRPPMPVEADGLPDANNDHVLSPDGSVIYASANDCHIYAVPRAGGRARRISPEDGRLHFLHGINPDGDTLAYVALELTSDDWLSSAHVRLMQVDGTRDRRLTSEPGPDDGPEFSHDGAWVYYNTEAFTAAVGHAQIARIASGGGEPQRLTRDERVNWFPHLSPDGKHATYLSYPPGTTGHPADLPVEIRVVTVDAWDEPIARVPLFGGQGTINVNSWAPDGSAFAYVDYPV